MRERKLPSDRMRGERQQSGCSEEILRFFHTAAVVFRAVLLPSSRREKFLRKYSGKYQMLLTDSEGAPVHFLWKLRQMLRSEYRPVLLLSSILFYGLLNESCLIRNLSILRCGSVFCAATVQRSEKPEQKSKTG